MKRSIKPQTLALLSAFCLLMTSCSGQVAEETIPESSAEQTTEETTEETDAAFTPIELTEDYDGPILGVENWHIEYEDVSWGSISYVNTYLIDDDTGTEFAAYGGVQGEARAFLTDLNDDGELELVCNTHMGSEEDMHSYTCIFRSNGDGVEMAFPCYGDLESDILLPNYPLVAEESGIDIDVNNYLDFEDRFDPDTNIILLTDRNDGTEYEIGYDCLQFVPYASSDGEDESELELPSDDIDIVYETAEPVVTDVSDTEKEVTFYRDGTEIEGKLYLPEGDGPFPVVVLSCGLMQPYTDYEADAQHFADNGYAAVVFSFMEYSDPDGDMPNDFGEVFMSQTKDLYAVMDSLGYLPKVDSDNVYLWGHSFGGLITAFAGCDRESEVSGMILVEPAIIVGGSLTVTYEDGTIATLRIYDLLDDCNLNTVFYMGTHDGYGDDPTSFDMEIELMPSAELVIIDGADHFFEGEYGEEMVEDACDKIASWQ